MNYERYITVTVNFEKGIKYYRVNEFLAEFKLTFEQDKNSNSRASNIESRLVEMVKANMYGVNSFGVSTKYKNIGDEPFDDYEGAYDDLDYTYIDFSNELIIQYVSARTEKNLIM